MCIRSDLRGQGKALIHTGTYTQPRRHVGFASIFKATRVQSNIRIYQQLLAKQGKVRILKAKQGTQHFSYRTEVKGTHSALASIPNKEGCAKTKVNARNL